MKKIFLIQLLIYNSIFIIAQTSPAHVEIKTIPDTLYSLDSIKFEIHASFSSGDGANCNIMSYTLDKTNDTFF